jgi:molybdenum cofactor biosynthesis enzyme MoaA
VNRRCPLHCPYCSNPVNIGADRYRAELETEHWTRVFRQARALGVVRLALTGGEPMRRRDLDELVAAGRAAGRYSTLVTGGTRLTGERAERLKQAGLDHVQVSIQSPHPEDDRIAGNRSFEKKIAVARATRELGLPLTINCVLHRQNLDRIEELLALAEELDAQRLELANTATTAGRSSTSRRSSRRAPSSSAARRRCSGSAAARLDLARGGRVRALPRDGLDAGAVPLVSARAPGGPGPLRCQALRLTGDAAADPVCRFSPHHGAVVAARESAPADQLTYRTMRQLAPPDHGVAPRRRTHRMGEIRLVCCRHG